MRIASLLPSTTEIVAALGLADQLVAISHACDYPSEVASVARVTRAAGRRRTSAAGSAGKPGRPVLSSVELGAWELDSAALREASPDLVLAGDAGGSGDAQAAIRAALPGRSEASVVSIDPVSLEGVFNVFTTVGAMTEAEDEAIGLVEMLREDLGALEEMAVQRREQGAIPPRAVVLEGLRPPLASERWIPELVRLAGGWDVLGCLGEPREGAATWQQIRDVDPQMIVLAPRGLDLQATQAAWRKLVKPAFWREIDAVQRGQVFAVEPVYLNRPGPRIVGAVGMLAEIFDPDGFVDTSPPYSWTPLMD